VSAAARGISRKAALIEDMKLVVDKCGQDTFKYNGKLSVVRVFAVLAAMTPKRDQVSAAPLATDLV
jgi:hypothetical protein